MKGTRRGGSRKQLLDDLKETRGYWKLKEEALDRSVENWLWKRLWSYCKTENRMSEINVTVFWDMTPCSLVNMNTDVSDKPAG